jgi:hypothetical protein
MRQPSHNKTRISPAANNSARTRGGAQPLPAHIDGIASSSQTDGRGRAQPGSGQNIPTAATVVANAVVAGQGQHGSAPHGGERVRSQMLLHSGHSQGVDLPLQVQRAENTRSRPLTTSGVGDVPCRLFTRRWCGRDCGDGTAQLVN